MPLESDLVGLIADKMVFDIEIGHKAKPFNKFNKFSVNNFGNLTKWNIFAEV